MNEDETPKTATLIKDSLKGFRGHAALYRVDPPMGDHDWKNGAHEYDACDGTGTCKSAPLVIVSAANVMFSGPETYIFPGTEDGEVDSWGELKGSFKGALDHERALANAGYAIAHGEVSA